MAQHDHDHDITTQGFARLTLMVMALWTVFGLLASFQMYANTIDDRVTYTLGRVLILGLGNSWLKGVLTIPLLLLLRRIPYPPGDFKKRLPLYGILLPAFVVAHVCVRPFIIPFFVRNGMMGASYSYTSKVLITFRSLALDDAWGFCCVILAFHAWQYAEQMRIRSVAAERLRTRLAQAELQVLKMQLQPHFLFNTLNTIYNLTPLNSRKAQLMISRLSELLRISLDHAFTDRVSLERELQFLGGYLEIEKTRFEERLRVFFDIDDDTLDAQVPSMILQPLVENSIRHGLSKKAAGGSIRISASRLDDWLRISIADDGNPPSSQKNGFGIGLSNTRARLQQLYGNQFHFEIGPNGAGTKVSLEIPFRSVATNTEEQGVPHESHHGSGS